MNNGGPAFPESCGDQIVPGMRLLDYYAGEALKGLAAGDYPLWSDLAKDAFNLAEAMIAEREKRYGSK